MMKETAYGHRIAAAILIGGRSSRMGHPKEDIVIPEDGRTFLDRICDEIDKCYGECLQGRYLSVRKGQKKSRDGYSAAEDKYDDIGPLGGLISVLMKAREDGYDAVLLLACDMIYYGSSEIKIICQNYEGQDIIFARTEGRYIQPLASIYSVNILPVAEDLVKKGNYRLRDLAEGTDSVGYFDSECSEAYINVNTVSDQSLYCDSLQK